LLRVATHLRPSSIHGIGVFAGERIPAGAEVWRTDRDGAVRVESDGARLTVSAFCSPHRWHSPDLKSHDPFGSS